MATIKDVARVAGVSPATVSYVLNQTAPVRESTRQRVLAAVQQLKYQPNQLARNLQGQRSATLAFVIGSTTALDIDVAPLLYACVLAATAVDYSLLVQSVPTSATLDDVVAQVFGRGLVDGCIVFDPYAAPCADHGPLIWGHAPPRGSQAPAVSCDGALGAQRAVAALVHSGCQRVGIVLPPDTQHGGARWYLGYRRMLKRLRKSYDPSLVVAPAASDFQAGTAAGEALLAAECDGIVVAGSHMAVGVAEGCQAPGQAIPVIAGYDSAFVAGAQLSALVWPLEQWGRLLVDHLLACITQAAPARCTFLQPTLIIRS